MLKLKKRFLSFLVIVSVILSGFIFPTSAYNQSSFSDLIFSYIKEPFVEITGNSYADTNSFYTNAKEMEELNASVQSILARNYSGTALNNIVYIQGNYCKIVSSISKEEKADLDAYLLLNTLDYYKTNSSIEEIQSLIFINSISATAHPYAYGDPVAKVTVFSDPNGTAYSSGHEINTGSHAFISVKNISSSSIVVGNLTVPVGKTITVGTWGNKGDETGRDQGLWYGLEARFIATQANVYTGRISISLDVDEDGLSQLSKCIRQYDDWSLGNNCSSFARAAWNVVAPAGMRLVLLIDSPLNLANLIKTKQVGS